jgi:hypothetical protein
VLRLNQYLRTTLSYEIRVSGKPTNRDLARND